MTDTSKAMEPFVPVDCPPVPSHVPPELIRDIRMEVGGVANDLPEPYLPSLVLRDPAMPRILFFPWPLAGQARGMWTVSHYEDIRRVYEDNEVFSSKGAAQFQRLAGETFPSIPLGIDPPEHTRYRKFLNPFFTPVAMGKLEPHIRSVVSEMIDEFVETGEVDIAYDFGRVFPVRIFLNLMGLPFSMFDQFLAWEWDILHNYNMQEKAASVAAIIAYLRGFIEEKRANPDDKLGSYIANEGFAGKPFDEDEVIGMVWFLWLGGLDTVASTISQMFRRLGLDQALQQRIRADPALIPTAVEEFLRMQPLVNSGRVLKKDIEWHGVQMKAGDWIACINSSGNFDDTQFADPYTFDPARKANRHFTFVGGVHNCLGAHLARRELRVLLDEWFKRVPPFKIKDGADTSVVPSLLSIRNLPLVWETS